MKSFTLDTNIVSALLKGNKEVKERFSQERLKGNSVSLNAISWYEIKRGLLKINAMNKTTLFEKIFLKKAFSPSTTNRC